MMMVEHCTKKTNKSFYKKNKKIKTSLLPIQLPFF